ncbi:MAG: hypothetical protein IJ789_00830 [Bacteroidales bacterium]|nr:hypothetical protein [Bacteroidales bacterium]
MMNKRLRNRIAWLLAVAYLPMLMASAFHVHHQSVTDDLACGDCVRHVAHPAHFGQQHSTSQPCLVCHILSLPKLSAAALVLIVAPMIVISSYSPCTVATHKRPSGHLRLRAPPVL